VAIWFTADTHFGHARIIELARRPFASVEAMDEAMIAHWNERVAAGDLIYHLGDFALKDHNLYLPRLAGQKRLIRGNHDHSRRIKAAVGWQTVDTMLTVEVEGIPIVLCHYGLRVWNKSHHGALHFYGHSHGSLAGDSQSIDVGVDCWDFRPVSVAEIKARLATQPIRQEPDHHRGRPVFAED
jgi:calcineurin-like phosphoesterase family protein